MCLKGIERLGKPLATMICAHPGGLGERVIRHMQTLQPKWDRMGFNGIRFEVLENGQEPNGVYLKDEPSGSFFGGTFRMAIENGGDILTIRVPSRLVTMNRERGLAGSIFSAVYRGNNWKDRGGNIHNSALP